MSDPLTSFANEEDDIEKVLDEINEAQKTDDEPIPQADDPTDVVSDDTEDTKVPDEAELKAVDVEDDDEEDEFLASPRMVRIISTLSRQCFFLSTILISSPF